MKDFLESEGIERRTQGLLTATEKPHNVLEHQIVLAEELYMRDHPSATIEAADSALRNDIMLYWLTQKYSRAFRDLINHKNFKTHPRFNNDPLNVTLSDTEYFLHNQDVPER